MWHVRVAGGERLTARALVMACGQLNRPAYPGLRGEFGGVAFHSARWDHAYDLTAGTSPSIGTGASAIQFVPHVAEQAERVYVFQRTPPYVVDKPDRPYRVGAAPAAPDAPPADAEPRQDYAMFEARALGFITLPEADGGPHGRSARAWPSRSPTSGCAPR